MGFRDDREAQKAHREALEVDLNRANERLQEAETEIEGHERKDRGDEEQLRALKKEVSKLRQKLGVDPKVQSTQRRGLLVGAGVAVVTLGGVIAAVAANQPQEAPTSSVTQVAQPVVAPTPIPQPEPNLPPDRATTPLDVAQFGAEVLTVEGLPLAVGDACLVTAQLRVGPSVGSLRVTCGEQVVYDNNTSGGTEMTLRDSDVQEIALADRFVYVVRYSDTGQRTGPRPQIRGDTARGDFVVFRDNANPFRLTLRVDDQSSPRFDRALGATTTTLNGDGFRLRATRLSSSGPAPSIPDQGCEVLAHPVPAAGTLNCRVFVQCGEDTLYGADTGGYNRCSFEEGIIESASDQNYSRDDSDPKAQLDRSEGLLVLADDAPEPWEIQFRLEEDPRCSMEGNWKGNLVHLDGTAEDITLVGSETILLTHDFADSAAIASGVVPETNCIRGTAVFVDEDGNSWEGRFGPGFQTLIGRVRGGDPRIFALWRTAP